jgi:vacuolar-type H+-ATPase subunit C/Vma6
MLDAGPYAYAKACGILSKSFMGARISSLSGLQSLSELHRLVFPDHHSELPGKELLADLENRIIARAVRQILAIIGAFSKPPEIIARMLRVYEYNDLKTCINYIAGKKKETPHICDIGRFRTVNFNAYPDIAAMIKDSEFNSLLSEDIDSIKDGNADIINIEMKLDSFFYQGLVNSLSELSGEDRSIVQRFLADEISLRNCTWALRLRTYYNMREKETVKYLMKINLHTRTDRGISLADDAIKSLDFPLDSRLSWESWKWKKLLNSEEGTAHWKADTRHFQNAASQYLYRIAMRGFHRLPMSVSSIFYFIKLKQFEEDLLTSIAEGFALGIDSTVVFNLLEVHNAAHT